jgi:hypothetical protein
LPSERTLVIFHSESDPAGMTLSPTVASAGEWVGQAEEKDVWLSKCFRHYADRLAESLARFREFSSHQLLIAFFDRYGLVPVVHKRYVGTHEITIKPPENSMRLLPSILTLACCLATSTIAHADTITWIVSIVGSGSLGTQTFTAKRITLIDTATTQNYYQYTDFGGPGFAFCCFLDSSTVTIAGIGTFGSGANEVDTEFSNSGLAIGDSEDRLSIASGLEASNTPESLGPIFGNGTVIDGCDPDFGFPACPGYISTDVGNLIINSFDSSSATGQEILSACPNPLRLLWWAAA